MMQKVLFTAFAELKQGDGKGPKYFAGKAYWLSPDQAVRWISEGVAEDAPADMIAENEPAEFLPHPKDVRLVRVSRGRYDVLGLADHKYNDEPLMASDAEKLRQRVLAGEIKAVSVDPAPAQREVDPNAPAAITLRVESNGEEKTYFVAAPWPARTIISEEVLNDPKSDVLTIEGELVTFTMANGMAVYKKSEKQSDPTCVELELCEQTYEPAPEAAAE